jgi:hypothetical protein
MGDFMREGFFFFEKKKQKTFVRLLGVRGGTVLGNFALVPRLGWIATAPGEGGSQ